MRPEIIKINGQEPEASLVTYAAEKIRAGEVLGMPTDTFYGLAVDPFNLHAVDRVYEIKTRLAPQAAVVADRVGGPGSGAGVAGAGNFLPVGPPLLAGTAHHHREGRSEVAAQGDRQHRQRCVARTRCAGTPGNHSRPLDCRSPRLRPTCTAKPNARLPCRCAISWAIAFPSSWTEASRRA